MFTKRIGEINARKAELRKILESDANANLDEIEKELRDLDTEMQGLERRKAIASGINTGSIEGLPVNNPVASRGSKEPTFTKENVLSSPEYRTAWAKTLMQRKLSEVEKRALETAMTTTATEFVAATAETDGINNGGLFIPTDINTALMEAISLVSPIFRDAARTAIPGLLKFPYKKTASGAKNKKETEQTADGSIEWAELTLGLSEISETIRVSWKLEAMAVEEFISYITAELIEQVQDKAVTELIYGSGSEQLKGATVDAIKHEYTGTALDGIGETLEKLGKKQKIGAKIYVAQSIVEEISFTKDNNGNYIFTPINGVGVKSVATYPVEVDPYLKDGDFVIGNVKRYYRLNVVEPISIAKDSSGKKRANDYTAYTIMGGAAQPNTLAYGKKKASA
jgi:HK97 family phage major capsid protein